jgi:hypothetical protein
MSHVATVKCERRSKGKTVPAIQLHINSDRNVKLHTSLISPFEYNGKRASVSLG